MTDSDYQNLQETLTGRLCVEYAKRGFANLSVDDLLDREHSLQRFVVCIRNADDHNGDMFLCAADLVQNELKFYKNFVQEYPVDEIQETEYGVFDLEAETQEIADFLNGYDVALVRDCVRVRRARGY
jgi:hypothetical protein